MEASSSSTQFRELEVGPIDTSVLTLQHEHRSNNKELMMKEDVVDCHDHSSKLKHIPCADPRVQLVLQRAGFLEISKLGFFKIDHALMTSLVDRWRPETSSFHFPPGEMTVTLADVGCLLGVPIEGYSVTTAQMSNYDAICEECLGTIPPRSEIRGGTVKLTWLRETFHFNPAEDASEQEIEYHARAVILHIISCRLLPDHSKGRVNLYWLLFLRDLDDCSTYSWGSAILAKLYNELTNVSLMKSKSIAGCLTLLQLWSWTHLPIGRPTTTDEQIDVSLPYSVRWFGEKHWIETPKNQVTFYRDQIDLLTREAVTWNPYTPDVLEELPQICLNGMESWRCKTPIICMRDVEIYSPDRVMRQFGLRQHIPDARESTPELNLAIIQWIDRHNHIVHQRIPRIPISQYESWYWNITRRFISERAYQERAYIARAPLERDVVDGIETVAKELGDIAAGLVREEEVQPKCLNLKKILDTILGRNRLQRPSPPQPPVVTYARRGTRRRRDTPEEQAAGPSQPPPTQ